MMISKDLIPDLMNFIPTHSFFHEEVLKFEVPKKKDKATEKLKNSKKVPIEKSQELMIRRCSSIDRISSNSQKKKVQDKILFALSTSVTTQAEHKTFSYTET